MTPLANATAAFLKEHAQALVQLLEKERASVLARFQAELHTLAAIAFLFPGQARLLRLQVNPEKGRGGSVVMTSVLDIDGQWFEFTGPVEREQVMERIHISALKQETTAGQFVDLPSSTPMEEVIESYLPRAPHPKIYPYVQAHLPGFIAAQHAAILEEDTPVDAGSNGIARRF